MLLVCVCVCVCVCTFNRGTECDSVYESCGVKVYLENGAAVRLSTQYVRTIGAVIHTHGTVVLVVQMFLVCCVGGGG